ncbi:hypothetical protein [Vibrio sp. YIC-376]|uniref:hypothetical protein n=1 Tax=Vibrio sp. YIC-376 TaxID=3136162 RepID=UPI00402AA658
MKKIISLIVLFSLAGCVTTSTSNPALSTAYIDKCQDLGKRVVAQDTEFKPALSLSSLVLNELPVVAEDFQDGILTCSLAGASDNGYAIAYAEDSDILLHQKFSGSNKNTTLKKLTKEVAVVEQRLQSLEQAEREREESAKREREQKARREAAKSEQIKFCLNFAEKYADILKVHGMTVGKVSVANAWDNGDSMTCVNNYDGFWADDEKENEQLQEQHVVNKKTGEYQTIFR